MTARRLYLGQAPASAAAVYTSTNAITTITAATVCNTTAGALTFSAWTVSTGSETDASAILQDVSVGAGETLGIQELVGHVLEKGEALWLEASAATSLTFRISGNQ